MKKILHTPEEVAADLARALKQNDPYLLIMKVETGEGSNMRFALRSPSDLVAVLVHQALHGNESAEALRMCHHLQKMGRVAEHLINQGLAERAANN